MRSKVHLPWMSDCLKSFGSVYHRSLFKQLCQTVSSHPLISRVLDTDSSSAPLPGSRSVATMALRQRWGIQYWKQLPNAWALKRLRVITEKHYLRPRSLDLPLLFENWPNQAACFPSRHLYYSTTSLLARARARPWRHHASPPWPRATAAAFCSHDGSGTAMH